MKLKLLSKKDNGTVQLLVTETTPAMLNMYRRMILEEVPSMAIDTIDVSQNSSALYDEMLAHRMGLLVLKTDIEASFLKDNNKYKVNLTLEAEGPCIVTADMLKSKDPAVVPVHGKAPLTKLLEGQSIKLIATAATGSGKEHVKFSPGLMFYQKFPYIKDAKKAEKIMKSCPVDKEKKKVEIHNVCMACRDAFEESKATETKDTDYFLTLEPWGQYTASELFDALGRVANARFEEFSVALKKLK
tara:strand:- start:8613 stop:9344 length:732 start_codon:yes stop_codon:yes gene_type:complete